MLGGLEAGKVKAKKGLKAESLRRIFGRWRLEAEKGYLPFFSIN